MGTAPEILPSHDGAAGSVPDERGDVRVFGCGADSHPVRLPVQRSVAIDPLSEDIEARAAPRIQRECPEAVQALGEDVVAWAIAGILPRPDRTLGFIRHDSGERLK